MQQNRKKPVVFVSSTCYDLKQVREDIKDFFEKDYGFEAMLSEFDSFPINPCKGTFENCLGNVDNYADFFVLIIGTRYGYVTDIGKSITNLEYLHARAKGIPTFVFVNKQLYDSLPLWRSNPTGDFSSIVDNSQIYEFIASIYDECTQWVYTFENVRDITMAMKNQLSLIFSDGLKYNRIISTPKYAILNSNICEAAMRTVIEQPYAWEYKFLAYVLKDEFEKLQKDKWDFKYGFFEGTTYCYTSEQLIDDISEKLNEILELVNFINIIINSTLQDAIGKPGEPSDLEMIIYTAKRLSSIYKRMVSWGLYFKAVHADDMFSDLLGLLYELPESVLKTMDDFVDRVYKEIAALPDVETGHSYHIELNCTLDVANTPKIIEEIERLTSILKI